MVIKYDIIPLYVYKTDNIDEIETDNIDKIETDNIDEILC
jgi:hypothetical protein